MLLPRRRAWQWAPHVRRRASLRQPLAGARRDYMASPHEWTPRGGLARAQTAARGPDGRLLPNTGPAPKRDKTVTRAMTVIRMAKAKNKGPGKSGNRPAVLPSGELPAVPAERPWDQMSKGEKLSAAADMALDIAKAILELASTRAIRRYSGM